MERPPSSAALRSALGRKSLVSSGSAASPTPTRTRPVVPRVPAIPSSNLSASPLQTQHQHQQQTDDIHVGDLVYASAGQRGVVLFIGNVHGKAGVFAGIDLVNGQGKNNGSVDGVRYFTTSSPTSGLFIPISKCSLTPPSDIPATPRSRSVLSNRAPSRASSALGEYRELAMSPAPALPQQHNATPKQSARRVSGVAAPPLPHSAVRRASRTPANPSSRLFSPSATVSKRTAAAVEAAASTTPSAVSRKSTVFPKPRPSLAGDRHASDDDSRSDISALDSGETAYLAQVNAALKYELTSTKRLLELKETEFATQEATLTELQQALSDYTVLADRLQTESRADDNSAMSSIDATLSAADDNREDDSRPPTKRELDLRMLLQDRDAKLESMQRDLDTKRSEFRETMEALEQANLATNQMYEARIEELVGKVYAADGVIDNIAPLEEMISKLEVGLDDSRAVEAEIRSRNDTLVEESRLKDQQIEEYRLQLEALESNSTIVGTAAPNGNPDELQKLQAEVAELEHIVETKIFREQELERDIVKLREELSNVRDALRNETSQNEKLSQQVLVLQEHQTIVAEMKSPLMPASKLSMNGQTNGYTKSPDKSKIRCELCDMEGHDILDCQIGLGNGGMETSGDSMIVTPKPAKKLWCALCERDGHASLDCPYDGL
ncbi:uncharacterized protein V1518DRAFT_416189 [Limtongia smithiae]|uniref:uncharacterized protein n=1 Tax=Limtongia smithiae TaxID=1125753 RepID=UPI0034CF55E3